MDLLVRLPNWVGDVCMALPALDALAARGVRPHVIGKGWSRDLLAAHPYPVDAMPKGFRPALAAVREIGIPRGLLLTNSLGSALRFRLAGVRAVGYRAELRTPLLARGVPRRPGIHEVESFWRLAHEVATWLALPPMPETPPPVLGLRLTDAHRAQAAAALERAGVHGSYVVLAPLAAGTVAGQSKLWPGFPLFARLLAERGTTMVACPGPGEEAACAAAVPGARMLPGLGLGAYAAVCAGAVVTVANDSGPMHLAAAVDAPVVGVFGVSDPQRTRPWGTRAQHLGGTEPGEPPQWPSADAVVEAASRHLG